MDLRWGFNFEFENGDPENQNGLYVRRIGLYIAYDLNPSISNSLNAFDSLTITVPEAALSILLAENVTNFDFDCGSRFSKLTSSGFSTSRTFPSLLILRGVRD